MWRKTRRPQSNYCIGVDGNRNFGFHHAGKSQSMNNLSIISPFYWFNLTSISTEMGGSTNPCNEIYAGVQPFSEPETIALSQFVKSFDNIRLYLSFHSYGQMLLFPYVNIHRLLCWIYFLWFLYFHLNLQGHTRQRAVNYNSLVRKSFVFFGIQLKLVAYKTICLTEYNWPQSSRGNSETIWDEIRGWELFGSFM